MPEVERMKNILVTGGRAPATLHLIRLLSQNPELNIYVADSIGWYLSAYSECVRKAFRCSKPNKNNKEYKRDILNIISAYRIGILIPTCEEIYHLSRFSDEMQDLGCLFMGVSFDELIRVHNKWSFYNFCKTNQVDVPDSSLHAGDLNFPLIAKMIYSRFGSSVKLIRKETDLIGLRDPDKYLFQQFLNGTEICTYSLAYRGETSVTVMYESNCKLKKNSPNICYVPMKDERIEREVSNLIRKLNWSGQIGFDIIKDFDGNIRFIECNPRLTSGIFLLGELQFENSFLCGKAADQAYGITLLSPFLKKKNLKVKDCVFIGNDRKPFFMQYAFFMKNIVRSVVRRTKLSRLLVEDIEWNG